MGYISNLIMTFLTFVMVSANLEAENLCLYKSQGNFWKISSLKPDTGVLSVADSMRANNLVEFNICEKVKCGDDEAYAVLRDTQTGKCSVLTDNKNNPKVTPQNGEDLNLLFSHTGDANCDIDPAQNFQFEMILACSDDEKDFESVSSDEPSCKISIRKETKVGCPVIRGNAIWKFLDNYSVYVTPAVIVIGVFFLILGGYFKKISVFLIVLTSVVFISIFLLYAFILPYSTGDWAGWVIIAVAVGAGAVVAFFLAAFIKLGVFILGAWVGGMLATTLYGLFVYKISSSTYMLWGLIAVMALLVALLSLKLFRLVLVIGTSFIGAYMIIRGAAVYIGGYTNEFQLINEIQAGDISNISWSAYLYIAAIFVLAVLGILFQQYRFKLLSGGKGGSPSYSRLGRR